MKPRPDFDQRSETTVDGDAAFTGCRNSGEQFEQRALAGAVAPDDSHGRAPLNLKRDVSQTPEVRRAPPEAQPVPFPHSLEAYVDGAHMTSAIVRSASLKYRYADTSTIATT